MYFRLTLCYQRTLIGNTDQTDNKQRRLSGNSKQKQQCVKTARGLHWRVVSYLGETMKYDVQEVQILQLLWQLF